MGSRNDHSNRFKICGIDWQEHCRNLTAKLRELEWSHWRLGGICCPSCFAKKADCLHREDCELAALLAVDLWAMTEAPKTNIAPDPDVRSNRLITNKQAGMLRGILLCIHEHGAVPSIATLRTVIKLTNSKGLSKNLRGSLWNMKNKGMITALRYDLGSLRVTESGLAALALYDKGDTLR